MGYKLKLMTEQEEQEIQDHEYLKMLYWERDMKVKAECKYRRTIDSPYEGFPYVMRIPVVKLKHDIYLNKCKNCGEIDNPHLNRGDSTPMREYQRVNK